MHRQLNKVWFEKYFFYGLENKNEVVKWIIVNGAKKLVGKHKELDKDTQKTNYEKDRETILELIVQLERFTSLHDDPKHRQYFYHNLTIHSEQVYQIFNKNAIEIEKTKAVCFVTYRPVSGIFFNTKKYSYKVQEKYQVYSGEELLARFGSWVEEVYEVLCYLSEIEKENRIEYYLMFLDSKYGRAMHRYKNNVTDDKEIREIRAVYRKFLENRLHSGIDLKLDKYDLGYEMITTLKSDAIKERDITPIVKREEKNGNNMILKRNNIEFVI